MRPNLQVEEFYVCCDYCGTKNLANPVEDESDPTLDFCDETCRSKHRALVPQRYKRGEGNTAAG